MEETRTSAAKQGDRRVFLRHQVALAATTLATIASRPLFAWNGSSQRRPKIVLRSSWQTVNIGDVGHTPGVLRLLAEHLPEADVRLWPSNVDNGVEAMLKRRFPNLDIVKGASAQKKAMDDCDFLLHGSGPSLVAEKDVARWIAETGKPFGVYGITLPTEIPGAPPSVSVVSDKTIELLNQAKFVFFRDSISLGVAKDRGCRSPVMEFAPDGAFAVDVANDELAETFLREKGLQRGNFLCCIPRYRYTPYWLIHPERKRDLEKERRNEEMKEKDHVPLRQSIIKVLDRTDFKILLCPEDKTQMAIGKEMIFDRLPDAYRNRVVWREQYWLTDEAVSVYRRSAGLFGNEMHSPIMCLGNRIPAIVCRFAEQTSKGMMWRDIGLEDWLFDLDKEGDADRIPNAVLDMATNKASSEQRVEKALAYVRDRQMASMKILAKSLEI